jgi:uncharacterized membrane protein
MFAGTVATVFSNSMAMPKALSFVVLVRSAIDQDGTVSLEKKQSYRIADLEASAAAKRSSNRTEARQGLLSR